MIDWLETLSPNEREAFLTFCKKHSSPIQMYLYARFLGYAGSIADCDQWQQTTFKKTNLQQIFLNHLYYHHNHHNEVHDFLVVQ